MTGKEAEIAKLVKQACVNDGLNRGLHKGQEGLQSVKLKAKGLVEKYEPLIQDGVLESLVFRQSVGQVVAVAKAAPALSGESVQNPVEIVEKAYSDFEVFKHKVSQVAFWRDCDRKLKEYGVAMKTLMPELLQQESRLAKALEEGEPGWLSLEHSVEIAKRLTVWDEGLLPGARRASRKQCNDRGRGELRVARTPSSRF